MTADFLIKTYNTVVPTPTTEQLQLCAVNSQLSNPASKSTSQQKIEI